MSDYRINAADFPTEGLSLDQLPAALKQHFGIGERETAGAVRQIIGRYEIDLVCGIFSITEKNNKILLTFTSNAAGQNQPLTFVFDKCANGSVTLLYSFKGTADDCGKSMGVGGEPVMNDDVEDWGDVRTVRANLSDVFSDGEPTPRPTTFGKGGLVRGRGRL